MANIAIIPARGGSKRIPGKNIKDFLGKPIIAYSIQAAINSNLFDRVIVSTDNIDIAGIAKDYNADVPFMRSQASSDDFATTLDVIDEVISYYKDCNIFFDRICCLYPCAPFVTSSKLKDGLDCLITGKFDSVFPVVKFSFPIQRALSIENNKLSFIHPKFALSRSQDLDASYHDAGQFYWLGTEKYITNRRILSDNSGAIIVSELEAQDIDNPEDWLIAELKFRLKYDNISKQL